MVVFTTIKEKGASLRPGQGYTGLLEKMERQKKIKCELYRDSMQNYKKYAIPPAQLIIADVPYNVGNNFYGSNPMWYNGGDNKNGESKLAGKAAFNSDFNFNLYEYFHFCSKMLKKEDKKPITRGRSSNSPCMIVFCSFEQIQTLINAAAKHGFVHYIPLVFCKNYSPQVLKANMRIVGATEYALVLYRDRLPKFRNGAKLDENGKTIRGTGHMVFNWFTWEKDGKDVPKIHPAQKPVKVLKKLIEIFTDPGEVERYRRLKERDTAKSVDNRTIIQNFSGAPLTIMGDCPSCGCENIKSCNTDFCPVCGQRLKWEE